MVIKSSKEYHLLALILLICITFFFFLLLSVANNIVFSVITATLLIIIAVRYWISAGRVLIMDAEGCTVQFLWYCRTYKWTELETKRIEDYTNSIGYRQPYTAGVIFYKNTTRKPSWLMPAEYSMYAHPFSFFFVYFDPHIHFNKWDVRCPNLYVVDEAEFRANMANWNVELSEGDK